MRLAPALGRHGEPNVKYSAPFFRPASGNAVNLRERPHFPADYSINLQKPCPQLARWYSALTVGISSMAAPVMGKPY
jgi:hypothetical protein